MIFLAYFSIAQYYLTKCFNTMYYSLSAETKTSELFHNCIIMLFLGTTWTQEMVWLLANNLDYEKARRIPQIHRFPFLE
jgi:Na+/alanine symporter